MNHAAVKAVIKPEQKAILHRFDCDRQFGPVLEMTRLARWERAANLNLAPPPEVLQLLKEFPAENVKIRTYGSSK